MLSHIKFWFLSQKTIGFFTLSTIALMLVDLGAENTWFLYEIFTLILALEIAYKFLNLYLNKKEYIISKIKDSFVKSKWVIIFLTIYLLYDFLGGFFVGEYIYFWQKYRVIFSTFVICGGIFFYGTSRNNIKNVKYIFIIISVFISIFTLFNYIVYNTVAIEYLLKLTLRRDYNVFATVIYIGFVFGIFVPLEEKREIYINILGAFMVGAITIPVMLLSGSRRIYLSIMPTIAIWLIYIVVIFVGKNTYKALKLGSLVVVAIVFYGFVSIAKTGVEGYMLYVYHNPESSYNISLSKGGETTLKDRYNTAYNATAMEKRKIIWQIALDEYKNYNIKEKLIGRGTNYDILLYKNNYNPDLDKAYNGLGNYYGQMSTHNFILADLLNGGIVKAVLVALLLFNLGISIIKLLFAEPLTALPYGILMGILIISGLISGRFGLLYDKLFVILFMMLICQWGQRRRPFIYE